MKKIGLLCGVVLLSAVICVAAATQPSPTPIRGDGFEATDYNLSRDQLGTQLIRLPIGVLAIQRLMNCLLLMLRP